MSCKVNVTMTNIRDLRPPTLIEYERFVAGTRHAHVTDWRGVYPALLEAELDEFLNQHGPAMILMQPESFGVDYRSASARLRFSLADELSDLLWFSTDITLQSGYSLREIIASRGYGLETEESPPTFSDVGAAALALASDLKVPNKYGIMFPDNSHGYVSLEEYPGYVFLRAAHRVRRSLDGGNTDLSPPTATELEAVYPINETTGLLLLSIAYVAEQRLSIDFEDIARFSILKLHNRSLHGKENDISFTEQFVSRS